MISDHSYQVNSCKMEFYCWKTILAGTYNSADYRLDFQSLPGNSVWWNVSAIAWCVYVCITGTCIHMRWQGQMCWY